MVSPSLAMLRFAMLAAPGPCTAPASAPSLDHVIIAVHDLDSTAARFRALGYKLKPGRPHPNGLLNQHIKFRDGTEIELMTVVGPPTDRMAREYAALITAGDGGAYLALRIASFDSASVLSARAGLNARPSSAGPWRFLSFDPSSPISAVFFVAGGVPAVDPDSIFLHRDGAAGLASVSLEAGPALASLLVELGARTCGDTVQAGGRRGQRLALANGSVVVFPPADPTGPPRVLGAALQVSSIPAGTRSPLGVLPNFWLAYDGE